MNVAAPSLNNALRDLLVDVAHLPDDDVFVVAELIHQLRLKRQSQVTLPSRPSVASVRAHARQLATQIDAMTQAEVTARFMEVVDEIHAEAIAKGVAMPDEPEYA